MELPDAVVFGLAVHEVVETLDQVVQRRLPAENLVRYGLRHQLTPSRAA